MKGDPKIVQRLNEVLTNELTAIDQYFLHAKMFGHWGLAHLAERERKASIDEMKHADALIERILFLEGLPNLQDLHKLLIGENVKEALECDLRLELAAHPTLRAAIADSEAAADYVSRELFRVGGRAHRLARDPARPDRQAGIAQLPAVAGRRELTPDPPDILSGHYDIALHSFR